MKLHLYLLTQHERDGYDTYDACVVAAETAEAAQKILPSHYYDWEDPSPAWASTPKKVKVKHIGVAADGVGVGVVLASFNGG